jgi:uncharacterized protein with PQ loop repeat
MLIPQIFKTIKERNTSGVSILLFIMYLLANIIALVYSFLISQEPLIIKYIIGILTSVFYIGIYVYYTLEMNRPELLFLR